MALWHLYEMLLRQDLSLLLQFSLFLYLPLPTVFPEVTRYLLGMVAAVRSFLTSNVQPLGLGDSGALRKGLGGAGGLRIRSRGQPFH